MSTEFSLSSEVRQNALIIATNGYINKDAGEQIAAICYKHLDLGVTRVILNMGESKVINSIGISILIEIIEKLQHKSGRMIFTNLNPAVDKTLTIMGLFQLTDKAATVEEALGR